MEREFVETFTDPGFIAGMGVPTMRDMNRRLALTVAGSSALVVVTAGAAMAANLGILSASPSSGVGNLDATKVAELAVSTPASIEATKVADPTPEPASPAPAEVPSAGVSTPAQRVSPSSIAATPTAPPAPTPTPETLVPRSSDSEDEYETEDEYEDGEIEGSLDDHVQDDSFDVDSLHTVDVVVVVESGS